MLDRHARRLVQPLAERSARTLARAGIGPDMLTAVAFVIGVGACVAAGTARWSLALVLWLVNRTLDGIDGPLARLSGETERGGFLDLMADFAVYGGFVVGVAVAVPDARLACSALLASYYLNGSAFLALSSLAERHGVGLGDERSLRFVGGLAEGTETIVVHALFCVLPGRAALIAWVFAGMVTLTAVQRTVAGIRLLAGERNRH